MGDRVTRAYRYRELLNRLKGIRGEVKLVARYRHSTEIDPDAPKAYLGDRLTTVADFRRHERIRVSRFPWFHFWSERNGKRRRSAVVEVEIDFARPAVVLVYLPTAELREDS